MFSVPSPVVSPGLPTGSLRHFPARCFWPPFLRSYPHPVLSVVCHTAARPDTGVPAVRHFPLVPGSAIYYAAFYIFLNKGAEAAYYAAMTVKLGAAIALGILIAYSLPDCLFGWRHKNAKI